MDKWETEGDRAEFYIDEYHCLILRIAHTRHLGGYVGVPPEHPFAHMGYGDPLIIDEKESDGVITVRAIAGGELGEMINVHGGLTFAGPHKEEGLDNYWYFGFDCAHSCDFIPSESILGAEGKENYRDIGYVTKQIKQLVEEIQTLERRYNDAVRRLEIDEPVGGVGT